MKVSFLEPVYNERTVAERSMLPEIRRYGHETDSGEGAAAGAAIGRVEGVPLIRNTRMPRFWRSRSSVAAGRPWSRPDAEDFTADAALRLEASSSHANR